MSHCKVGNNIQLQIMPKVYWNIVFVAFHANPIGTHFYFYHTLHCIKLNFFWSLMHSYINNIFKQCVWCKIINILLAKSKELIYSFLIDAQFKIVHIDIYQVGTDQNFNDKRSFKNILKRHDLICHLRTNNLRVVELYRICGNLHESSFSPWHLPYDCYQ